MLRRNEPFPAVVLDRRWDILMTNAAYARIVNATLPAGAVAIETEAMAPAPRPHLLRLLCDPAGFRPHIWKWPDAARAIDRQRVCWGKRVLVRVIFGCLRFN